MVCGQCSRPKVACATMNDFTTNLTTLLVRELNAFARELDLYPDDASVWKTAPGITNSAGNLALHVAGNLQHFVGAVLGGLDLGQVDRDEARARDVAPRTARPATDGYRPRHMAVGDRRRRRTVAA